MSLRVPLRSQVEWHAAWLGELLQCRAHYGAYRAISIRLSSAEGSALMSLSVKLGRIRLHALMLA